MLHVQKKNVPILLNALKTNTSNLRTSVVTKKITNKINELYFILCWWYQIILNEKIIVRDLVVYLNKQRLPYGKFSYLFLL